MSTDLLAAYPAARVRFDEMFEAPSRARPHFQRLFSLLADTPAQLIDVTLRTATMTGAGR